MLKQNKTLMHINEKLKHNPIITLDLQRELQAIVLGAGCCKGVELEQYKHQLQDFKTITGYREFDDDKYSVEPYFERPRFAITPDRAEFIPFLRTAATRLIEAADHENRGDCRALAGPAQHVLNACDQTERMPGLAVLSVMSQPTQPVATRNPATVAASPIVY